jgi:hypothetical protein
MANIENRISRLEKTTDAKESGGYEFLIKYPDGNETHLYNSDGPPWQTQMIEVCFECEGEHRQEFEKNMQALLNGEIPGESDDTRTKN